MGVIRARFDDLRPRRRSSFRLEGLVETFSAVTPAEVAPVLDRAEDAVSAGRWVAGWVSYEAAVAFDDAFTVRPTAGTPFEDFPLAWFAVFERRVHADEPPAEESALDWTPTIDAERYRADIDAVHDHIRAGDTYQVNHTFRLSAPFDGDPERLYGRLARAQRAGYGAHLDAGRWAVASASPEVFFEWSGGTIACRPMKGTARRGIDAASDDAQRAALLASAKDRAENLMIVDMIRNDLARIAEPGSVGVPALFTAEKYDAWQLTSTVTARTRPETRLRDVFGALFPCASITGAPRASTMAIIADRETTPRGLYCGALGFGGPAPPSAEESGSAVDGARRDAIADQDAREPGIARTRGARWAFNVAIRTVLVDTESDTAWYGTGGGVTIDSAASGEYAEALLKTEVLGRGVPDFSLLETLLWTPEHAGRAVGVPEHTGDPRELDGSSEVATARRAPAVGFPLLERHLARLAASAEYFDVPLDLTAVRAALADAVTGRVAPTRVRLTVALDGTIDVQAGDLPPRAIATTTTAPGKVSTLEGGAWDAGEPVRAALDTVPGDSRDVFARHKTTRRARYAEASARHPGFDDVVLINERGELVETTIATLAVRLDGVWWTPPLASGCLPGVERAEALASGRLAERILTPDDLARADAIARLNSVRGWEPMVVERSTPPPDARNGLT